MKRALPFIRSRLRPLARHVRRWALRLLRHGSYLTIAAAILIAVAFAAAYVLLPRLAEQKNDIESFLSRETGYQIRIKELSTFWDGLHPGVHAFGVAIYSADATQPALKLNDLRVSLSPWPLLRGDLRISRLSIDAPRLSLERLVNGRLKISGLDAVATEQGDGAGMVLAWLGQEGRVEISNGELQWFDHREPERSVYIRDIELRLENRGEQHHISLTGTLPGEICSDCALIADVQGDPFAIAALTGQIYVRAVSLDIAALPWIAREHLPEGLRARVTTEFWSDWKQGAVVDAKGVFSVANVHWPRADQKHIAIRNASANFRVLHDEERFQFSLERALLQPDERNWEAGTVRYDQRGEARTLQVTRVDLAAITEFLKKNELAHDARPQWLAFNPVGVLADFRASVNGPLDAPKEYGIRAALEDVGISANEKLPAVTGLTGDVVINSAGGRLNINARELVLSLPRIFREAFPSSDVQAEVNWQRAKDHWTIVSESISVRNSDMRADGKLRLKLPDAEVESPSIDLQASFRDVDGSNARRYFPAHALEPKILRWMDSSFLGGHLTQARLVLQGKLREFPFEHGGGHFEVDGHVVDGVYEYLNGWTPVTDVRADVLVRGADILITGQGRIGSLEAAHIVVQTADLPTASGSLRRFIQVTADASGSVGETIRLLHAVKPNGGKHSKVASARWKDDFPADLRGSGAGWLGVRVITPFGAPEETRFAATYRFDNSELTLDGVGLEVRKLNGEVRFTNDGVRSGHVRGVALDGPADVHFVAGESDVTAEIETVSRGSGIAAWLGPQFAGRIEGEIPWRATWNVKQGLSSLRVEAPTLKSLTTTLPAPLDYPAGLPDGKLTVRAVAHRNGRHEFIAQAGQFLAARMLLAHGAGKMALPRGEITFGSGGAKLPDRDEQRLTVRAKTLDLDGWFALSPKEPAKTANPWLSSVRSQFESVRLFDRDFGRIAIALYRRGQTWSGQVIGEHATGELRFDQPNKTQRVRLDFSNLSVPKGDERMAKPRNRRADPRRLPILAIKTQRLVFEDRKLGALDLLGRPVADGWKLEHLILKRPEADAKVSGAWRIVDGKERSECHAKFESRDAAETSKALNMRGLIGRGTMESALDVSWPGGLADFALSRANGTMKVRSRDGSLSDIKEGAVRIFGALDVTSILRYMTLDFKPLVDEGFLYNSLKFNATLENGNLYTDDFFMKGRSADVKVSGRVGIAAEDLDLVLEVAPRIGGGAALASWWLWGPQAGAIALAIQQIFKSAGGGVRVIYEVKGTWSKPKVTRVVTDEDKKQQQRPAGEGAGSSLGSD